VGVGGGHVAARLAARIEIGGRQWADLGGWFEAFGASGFIGVDVFSRHGFADTPALAWLQHAGGFCFNRP